MVSKWRFTLGTLAGIAIAIAVCASLLFHLFSGGFTARAKVTTLESRLASTVIDHSVPDEYRQMRNQMANTPQYLQEGMEHFADHCASCHANNGSGDTMLGRGLNPHPPDLRLPATQLKSDGELYYIIDRGVRMSGMPAFGETGAGHDHGSWNLVTFIRHLPELTPQEELDMKSMNRITRSELSEQKKEDDFLRDPKEKGTTR